MNTTPIQTRKERKSFKKQRDKELKQLARQERRKWRRENNVSVPENYARKHASLLRNYNMSLFEYQQMLTQQQYKCWICQLPFSDEFRPNVDHDHRTGIVRGLLCRGCNTALGCLQDDPENIYRCLLYINHADKLNEAAGHTIK